MPKQWDDLSPAYRKRLQNHGITSKNYNTPAGKAKRQAARGHAKTPEHPERARRSPARYREYLQSRSELERQVQQRKEQFWGDSHKWRAAKSQQIIERMPTRVSGVYRRPDARIMRKFLRMTLDEVMALQFWKKDNEQWWFLFYH